ncbi:MAG: two-component sensor histidine kinase [Gemmatimonadetes bacterium]|nr:two-component sensor histidine kinase [Gemmatimonadota bacterium]
MSNARPGALARTGWLATTLALAVALVIGAFASYRGAQSAVFALNRGQADLLQAAVRDNFLQHTGPVVDSMLAGLMDEHEDAGLRYIALLDTLGGIGLSAGQRLLPFEPGTEPVFNQGVLEQTGERIRLYMFRPPTFTEMATQDSARRERSTTEPARRGPPQRRWIMIEMEPVLASTLENRAARSLALSIAAATILTLAALMFWRTSTKYEGALLRLEEQRRLTLLGEMSAVLAHEIRNPLASLKGNAQLLAERLPPDSREQARAQRVISEATRLEALTTDLLEFARATSLDRHPVEPLEVLGASIGDVADDGFEIDAAAYIAWRDRTSGNGHWPMDAARIRQTLVNVLQNARQASPAGSRPVVRVAVEDGRLVYEVRDFGEGLAAGTESRIFDPFFTTRTNGTGLGLAVARRAVEMHGGNVTARNHDEGGAVFRIEIPAGG